MEVTDKVRLALAEIAEREDLPSQQVDYAINQPAHHPNDWIFSLFDLDEIGFIYPENVVRVLSVFGVKLSEARVIDIIRELSGFEDTPVDGSLFDSILSFCFEICASFGYYW